MKVKVFEDYHVSDLEKSVNSFLATIPEEQIKYIKMSGDGNGNTAIAIFYTEK